MSDAMATYWATIVQIVLVFLAALAIEARWSIAHTPYENRSLRWAVGGGVVVAVLTLSVIFGRALSNLASDSDHRGETVWINTILGILSAPLVLNPIIAGFSQRDVDLALFLYRLLPFAGLGKVRRKVRRQRATVRRLAVERLEQIEQLEEDLDEILKLAEALVAAEPTRQERLAVLPGLIADAESAGDPERLERLRELEGDLKDSGWPEEQPKTEELVVAYLRMLATCWIGLRDALDLHDEIMDHHEELKPWRFGETEEEAARRAVDNAAALARERLNLPPSESRAAI